MILFQRAGVLLYNRMITEGEGLGKAVHYESIVIYSNSLGEEFEWGGSNTHTWWLHYKNHNYISGDLN